ncbi:MAG: sugar ABC transporter ATP-binding protein [Planctomycetota bacterium]|jgi:ribose transport system ATP-binding protein
MDSNIILKMNHIWKTFPGVTALDDIHFELRKGEVHVLLGENGAGKSTLVKILSGAYQKTSGEIFLFNRETNIRNPKHAQQLGISIIYQELNLIQYLSVGENIFLGREPMAGPGIINDRELFEASEQILRELGVEIDVRQAVKNLGVAEQQMVEVAKALSLESKILIMDEPTSALTEREIAELFATIRKLKSKGVSIIYISHRLDELFEIGDRVTVLRDGKCVGNVNIKDTNKSELIRMMVNRELKEQFPKKKNKPGEEVLRVESLSRESVLHDISFSLYRGEVLGISGLMGSGRTELARAIFGMDKFDSGSIYIRSEVKKLKSPRNAISMGIGFLTEDRKSQGLVLSLSVKENICLSSIERFSKLGRMAAAQYVKELRIKTSNLNQKVMYLSGGNQQKVVMSKWLCSQADILIFDEPTRGIDVGSKVEIYEFMNRLTAGGAAIIMISSELPEILGMSDRILVMHQGRITAEFDVEEASQEKILSKAI